MARLEEKDPRWIVENRADGANVNDWHWTERDCLPWLKQKASEALTALQLLGDEKGTPVVVKSVDVTGEATANNRKGKTFFLYELDVTLNWEGRVPNPTGSGTSTFTGTVRLPYLGDDNEDEDDVWEVKLSCSDKGKAQQSVLERLRRESADRVRHEVHDVLNKMKDHFTPKKAPPRAPSCTQFAPVLLSRSPAPMDYSGQTFKTTQRFKTTPKELYELLLDAKRLSVLHGTPATMENMVGGKFSYFEGSVTGENVTLVPSKRIQQRWRFSTWPAGHHSLVTLEFTPTHESETSLSLAQEGIPKEDLARTEQGWHDNFWERLRSLLAGGVVPTV
eukprot:TRINITY_DN18396_c0_g1_i1.p1 TRINITY_DN18396_c0_g1~~TRINITY_DN18396_c0_g1_i1.p1  ORF type:complete len:355 (-),score=89.21 TRINITY_DN18396_c0_g1_i1:65-1066(-)